MKIIMRNKFYLVISFVLLSITMAFSQETKKESKDTLTIGADLMSRYIFRGTDIGHGSPSIQPNLEYSRGKFAIGLWGAYSINITESQESDIYATYNVTDAISFTLTDYYFPTDDGNYKYFDYKKLSTGHLLEANISYSGTEKLPLTAMLATNFYGSDAIRKFKDGTPKGIQYSTYAELGYSLKWFDAFIGFNLTDPDESLGETGFYGDSFGVVNLGITATKNVKITKSFDLPLTFSLITNPQAQKIYFVFGLSI